MAPAILMAIAQLCQVTGVNDSGYSPYSWVQKHQLACQKHYIKCIGINAYSERMQGELLAKCVLETEYK